MAITNVTDHVTKSLSRLLAQYKEKPRKQSFIEAVVDEIQSIENAMFAMVNGRAITTAEGQQLDGVGTIVDQSRGTRDDDFYRILLYVKIGQNTSQGDAPKIINVFKLLTQADFVFYMNLRAGSIQLNTSGAITDAEVNFIYQNMELVVASGVRIDHIVCFDPANAFSFAGNNALVPKGGFADTAVTTGGKLASLKRRKTPFAFSGTSTANAGFGSLVDPLAGGTLAGI